ncbi:hypothetical protein PBY51_011168 [Eleginops maclovinus]|uniref:Mis18 domain-containing protein n=1 Tax=Eleginops maclovinus TaxID=56733 RepID=A0AAN7X9E1_ELEMC|nr:hypothetical protein PBY51_011168 [Eleginops maclovinus]
MEFDGSVLYRHAEKTGAEEGLTQWMTLHCLRCSTVLGDSLSVCGECVNSIVCLRVTGDVVVSETMKSGSKGEMVDCIYSSLKCRGCRFAVGSVIHSSPPGLAAVRSMFLLHKTNITCYILKRSAMVNASSLTFEMKHLRASMDQMQQEVEAQMDLLSLCQSRLSNSGVSVSQSF